MGALISRIIFTVITAVVPDWQDTLCGLMNDFAPVSGCQCVFEPSDDTLGVKFDLDCTETTGDLQFCFPEIASETFCVDCGVALGGEAAILGLQGDFDATGVCTLTQNDVAVVEGGSVALSGTVSPQGFSITSCGPIVALDSNGDSFIDCTCDTACTGEDEGKTRILCAAKGPIPAIDFCIDFSNPFAGLGGFIPEPN